LHISQQMPLPLTVSCSSKSRLVLTVLVLPFWCLLTRVVLDRFQQSSKTVVCVCVCVSEPYCHSILFVCLSVGHSATYSLPRLIDDNQIWSAGPLTRVSLLGSPVSHTLGARGKNMQNFAYFQHVFLPLRMFISQNSH